MLISTNLGITIEALFLKFCAIHIARKV